MTEVFGFHQLAQRTGVKRLVVASPDPIVGNKLDQRLLRGTLKLAFRCVQLGAAFFRYQEIK